MGRAKGILEDIEGRIGGLTVYRRCGETFVRPTHIEQPRRLSRKQLLLRERQSHNNALWRALKRSGRVYFEGGKTPYNRFMSVNLFSPVPYLQKHQYDKDNALLLPEMVVSDGPLPPIEYRIGEVEGRAALLTDLTRARAEGMEMLLYVLKQTVEDGPGEEERFRLSVAVEEIAAGDFVEVGSTQALPHKGAGGTLALVGERYGDPMMGYGIVWVKEGVASHQRVVTRSSYYKRYTSEEALQAAAKSYGGLTGEWRV